MNAYQIALWEEINKATKVAAARAKEEVRGDVDPREIYCQTYIAVLTGAVADHTSAVVH